LLASYTDPPVTMLGLLNFYCLVQVPVMLMGGYPVMLRHYHVQLLLIPDEEYILFLVVL
jgi:hypothetical protein